MAKQPVVRWMVNRRTNGHHLLVVFPMPPRLGGKDRIVADAVVGDSDVMGRGG